jgi:hypothetical protein
MADQFEETLANDFREFAKGEFDDVRVKVFLCGEGLDASRNIEDQTDSNLRAFLKVGIEREVKGTVVTLAEHKKLIDAYNAATEEPNPPRYSNLAEFELNLAQWADLIVLLPSSPGSIAELGMFAVHPKFARKLLIVFNEKYGRQSYIWNGPIKAAKPRGSTIVETDYSNATQVLETVVHRIRSEKSVMRTNQLLAE